jgi:ribonuclease HI
MSFEIHTDGSCVAGRGTWSFSVEYRNKQSTPEEIYADSGEEVGTTDIQMKLMAILRALTFIRSLNPTEPIIIKSTCSLCIRCITKEYDCTSSDAFKRDKVTRGFVQYLQEIWWKLGDMDVHFEVVSSENT